MSRKQFDFLVPYGAKGGVENIINLILPRLEKDGYRVRILQFDYSDPSWIKEGIEYHILLKEGEEFDLVLMADRLSAFYREHAHPGVIFACVWPVFCDLAKLALVENGIPGKVIYWSHHDHPEEFVEGGVGNEKSFQAADAAFVQSPGALYYLSEFFSGEHLHMIPAPVDESRICFSAHRAREKLLFVGRVDADKNVPFLINALAKSETAFELDIIGDGGERTRCEELVKEHGLTNRVHFLGWKEKPYEGQQDAFALVAASPEEASPLSILEGLLSGLPVISTRVGILPNLIKEGETGYLYDYGDESALIQILQDMESSRISFADAEIIRESAVAYLPENAVRQFEKAICGYNKIGEEEL